MDPIKIDTVEVDKCLQCEGLWFDYEEVGHILTSFRLEDIDSTKPNSAEEMVEDRLECPRCERDMNKVFSPEEWNGVIFDYCWPCHGVWFDRGELTKITDQGGIMDIINFLRKMKSQYDK
jgi:Zn-finger nucleic acid-binding protein